MAISANAGCGVRKKKLSNNSNMLKWYHSQKIKSIYTYKRRDPGHPRAVTRICRTCERTSRRRLPAVELALRVAARTRPLARPLADGLGLVAGEDAVGGGHLDHHLFADVEASILAPLFHDDQLHLGPGATAARVGLGEHGLVAPAHGRRAVLEREHGPTPRHDLELADRGENVPFGLGRQVQRRLAGQAEDLTQVTAVGQGLGGEVGRLPVVVMVVQADSELPRSSRKRKSARRAPRAAGVKYRNSGCLSTAIVCLANENRSKT